MNVFVSLNQLCLNQGCSEHHDRFAKTFGNWSAFHSEDYGYTRMQVINATHLYVEQVSVEKVCVCVCVCLCVNEFVYVCVCVCVCVLFCV